MLQAGRSRGLFPMRSLDSFILPNPSNRTMVRGSTQPLAEMSSRNPAGVGVKGGRRVTLRTLPPSVSRLSGRCKNLDVSKLHGPSRPVTGIALPFFLFTQVTLCWYICVIWHVPTFFCSVVTIPLLALVLSWPARPGPLWYRQVC
jgi:hypothetical protein